MIRAIALICIPIGCAAIAARASNPPNATAYGRLHLTFSERSPLSATDAVVSRALGDDRPASDKERRRWDYDLSAESFEAFVPRPKSADAKMGLFVFVSAGDANVSQTWFDVCRRQEMIFVVVNNAGNGREVPARIGLALDAVHNLGKRYEIDKDRTYIGGFSGGGGVAGLMILAYPDVFHGAFCMSGGSFYEVMRTPTERSATAIPPSFHGDLDRIKHDTRLVLLCGEHDLEGWPAEARANYDALVLDGFECATFLQVPRGGHNHPDATWFEKGLLALDSPKRSPPPTTAPTTDPRPGPGQVAQAQRLFTTAQWFKMRKQPERAMEVFQQLVDEYPTTPAAARARERLKKAEAATRPTSR